MPKALRLLPISCAVLAFTAGTAAHGQDSNMQSEFTAATTACLAAQQNAAFDAEPIIASGFATEQVPSEFVDRLLIFARPGVPIAITLDREDMTCAVRWEAESETPAQLADLVVGLMLEEASSAPSGEVQEAPPTEQGGSTGYPFMSGDALGLLVVTEEADMVLFQFVAVNRSRAAN